MTLRNENCNFEEVMPTCTEWLLSWVSYIFCHEYKKSAIFLVFVIINKLSDNELAETLQKIVIFKHFQALFILKVLMYLSINPSIYPDVIFLLCWSSQALTRRPYAYLSFQRRSSDDRIHLTWILFQMCALSGPAKTDIIFQPLFVHRLKFTEH